MDEVTRIYNTAADVLFGWQIESERATTFNAILRNTLGDTTFEIPVIPSPYESRVAETVIDSMGDTLIKMDKAAAQLEKLLKELKDIASRKTVNCL